MKNHWNDKKTRHGGPMPYQILGSSVSALFEYKIFRLFFLFVLFHCKRGYRTNVFTRLKGFHCKAMQTKSIKIILGR